MYYDYFISFLFMLLIASLIVNGWYVATRGWETPLPDGTVRKDGRILKWWYFLWNKKKGYDKFIKFDYAHMQAFMKNAVGINQNFFIQEGKEGSYETNDPKLFMNRKELEIKHGVMIDVEEKSVVTETGNKYYFNIYKREPDYVYPEWVRDMLVDCIYCFASFYGSIIFWTFHILAIGSSFYQHMYGWCNNPPMLVFITWIWFVIALSYVNGFLYKKIN